MQPDFAIYDIAEHKRMTVLFNAFRYGIKERSRSILNKQKCYDYLYRKLLYKALIALRYRIVRKEKCQEGATRLRIIHMQNLVVKSFSALLFNAKK